MTKRTAFVLSVNGTRVIKSPQKVTMTPNGQMSDGTITWIPEGDTSGAIYTYRKLINHFVFVKE